METRGKSKAKHVSLEQCFSNRESSLMSQLRVKQAIHDPTGKGAETENIVQELLLNPFLPPGFTCSKGSIISSTNPDFQSPAIDRVIFDTRATVPLLYGMDCKLPVN